MTAELLYRVSHIVDGPMAAKQYIGKVGRLNDYDEMHSRPVALDFGDGMRVWFRSEEVDEIHPNKVYPW